MWIQVLLVGAFVALALLEFRSGAGGARNQALRRLALLGFVVLAIFSVFVPEWLTWLAGFVGVGRGTDLVLYAFVVAFVGYVVSAHRRAVLLDRKITVLARRLALDEARLRADEAALRRATSAPGGGAEPDLGRSSISGSTGL